MSFLLWTVFPGTRGKLGRVGQGLEGSLYSQGHLYALQMPNSVFRSFYVLGLLLIFPFFLLWLFSSSFIFLSFTPFCLPFEGRVKNGAGSTQLDLYVTCANPLTTLLCQLVFVIVVLVAAVATVAVVANVVVAVVVAAHSNEVYPQQLFSKRALACV